MPAPAPLQARAPAASERLAPACGPGDWLEAPALISCGAGGENTREEF